MGRFGATLAVLFLLTLTCAMSAHAKKRVALVIGNADYQHTSSLTNPVNDADLIAKTLTDLGYEVVAQKNLGFKPMKRAIQSFIAKLEDYGRDTVGLVYYAGHGVQVGGQNYLLPVDAKIDRQSDVDIEAVNANALMSGMRYARNKLNIIIFDACRNNPYRSLFRDPVRGLARMDAPVGSYILFATSPGDVAADGTGANSPFTTTLATHIKTPGINVEEVVKRVGRDVFDATDGKQRPWLSSSSYENFYPAGQNEIAKTTPPLSPTKPKPLTKPQQKNTLLNIDRPQDIESGDKTASEPKKQQTIALNPPPKPKVKKPVEPAVGVYPPKTEPKRLPFEPEMVRIPSGTFRMGCVSGQDCDRTEKPVRTVTLKAFEIGKYEVTFAEWDACVQDSGCKYKPKDETWGRGKRPVINVNWDDITQQFIPWLNRKTGKTYRLPTEAEWEYVTRAHSNTPFWWGSSISTDQANYNGNDTFNGPKGVYRKKTVKVDSFKPNAFDLYNVHGNVWEWTQDCWHKNYKGAPTDGSAWLKVNGGECRRRVVRGGSWDFSPQGLRSAFRVGIDRHQRFTYFGFRLARTLE